MKNLDLLKNEIDISNESMNKMSNDIRLLEETIQKSGFKDYSMKIPNPDKPMYLNWNENQRRLTLIYGEPPTERPLIETKFTLRAETHPFLDQFIEGLIEFQQRTSKK